MTEALRVANLLKERSAELFEGQLIKESDMAFVMEILSIVLKDLYNYDDR